MARDNGDNMEAMAALLEEAQAAHAVYEKTELNGVYDQDWPRWYAAYAVDHGVGERLGREVTVDDLAAFLASSYADFEQADPKPAEPWPAYTARRLAEEL